MTTYSLFGHIEHVLDSTMFDKNSFQKAAAKTLKKAQSLSEGQKLTIAILGTIIIASLIFFAVVLLNNLIR